MSFHNGASMRRLCLVVVGVLISPSAPAQRGGGTPPPASVTVTSIPGVVAGAWAMFWNPPAPSPSSQN